jgi:hypothetical protein
MSANTAWKARMLPWMSEITARRREEAPAGMVFRAFEGLVEIDFASLAQSQNRN